VNQGIKEEVDMKRLVIMLVLVILLSVGTLGCAASVEEQAAAPAMAPPSVVIPAPAPMSPGRAEVKTAAVSVATEDEAGESWGTERMIVRTGNLALVVDDVADAINRITGIAEGFTGYVVSSNSWREGERLVGNISVRVPAERFGDAMSAFRGLAVDVMSESTSSRDVTEEYTDLESKLTNLEASEAQLLKLMDKAEKVEDILDIQKELARTRGEIEQTRGRMQYLERTAETSLIEVHLQQAKLEVRFTASDSRVKKGEEVWFYEQIAGGFAPYSFEWDFGDGNTATGASPVHVYKSPGTYTVSLSVTDDRGNTDVEIRSEYITILPGWNAGGVAGSAWNGLVTFGQVLADILIWLGIFSPVWLIAGGVFYWWLRRRKRRA